MKKRFLAALLAVLMITNICACDYMPNENVDKQQDESTEISFSNDTDNKEINTHKDEKKFETISRGTNYHFYKIVGTFELVCEIYDLNGKVIYSERTQRPINVSEIDSDLIEIEIGYGTGCIGKRYLSAKTSTLSEEFFGVIANKGTIIAYLENDSKKLIVQDIFQSSDDIKSFELGYCSDFSPSGISAEFSDDISKLYITYYRDENNEKVHKTLELS